MNLIKNKKICLNEFVAKKVLSARNLIKKCIRCGENFSPDKLHPYQKYCGYNCRTKAKYERKRKLMIKKCVICGNSFNPRAKQKTCSRKCSKRNKNSHSRRWNLKNWDNYGKYMKTYHKKQWKEYKEKYNIKSRNFVQQKVLISIINQILDFPRVIEEASFDWLKYYKSLKVDAYYPIFNLIVEYDGEQHFKPIRWNKKMSIEDANKFLKLQQKRDRVKEQLIKQKNITLVRFKFDEPLDKEYIKNKLLKNNIYIKEAATTNKL